MVEDKQVDIPGLPFEKEILGYEKRIQEMEDYMSTEGLDRGEERDFMLQHRDDLYRKMYEKLTAWERVQVARWQDRPTLMDYAETMFDDYYELHGDRCFSDDATMMTAFTRIEDQKFMLIGHRKGKNTQERLRYNYGMTHPEGYRKALAKMRLAEKYKMPIVTMINTPGAFPGIGAEERGQAMAIAVNIQEMFRIKVPIICIVIGEGGSGGALGIGVGDRVYAMENSYYSVISPEGCSAILWKSTANAPEAAEALKLTPQHLIKYGIIDDIIAEPPGAAHRNPADTMNTVRELILKDLRELKNLDQETLLQQRYERFRKIGVYMEQGLPVGMGHENATITEEAQDDVEAAVEVEGDVQVEVTDETPVVEELIDETAESAAEVVDSDESN